MRVVSGSQYFFVDGHDLVEHFGSLLCKDGPFFHDVADLGNRQNFFVPRSDPLVFAMAGSEIGEVGELVKVQKIGDSWGIAYDVLRFVIGHQLIQFFNSHPHLLPQLYYLRLIQGLARVKSSKKLPKWLEKGNSEVVLVPRHVLIDYCSFLDVIAVPMRHIGIFFAEIGEDGSALSQNEIAVLDARNQSKWIDVCVALAFVLHLGDIYPLGNVRDAADVKQGFNCSARLAANTPKMSDFSHYFAINNDANGLLDDKSANLSQFWHGLDHLDTLKHLGNLFSSLEPLMSDSLDFRHLVNLSVPSLHLLVLIMLQPQQDQVGHFGENEEVSNSNLISRNELCLVLREYGLKSSNGLEQPIHQCLLLLFLNWFFGDQSRKQISDWSNQEMSEVVLIPRDVLIGNGSLFKCLTIVNRQIGISLTKIDHYGSTFSQHKISRLQDRNLPDWIHLRVILLPLLSPQQIHLVEGARNLADVDDGLDCPCGLADDVPVESDVSHWI